MSIESALNIITSQHRDKPKYVSWISASLSLIDSINAVNITSAFDLDNAIGVQLDTLGAIVGVNRALDFQPTGGDSPVLDDATYRLVLKAKIIRNQWDGTVEQLYANWKEIFPDVDLIIKDNQDMSIVMLVIGMAISIEQDLVKNGYVMPKPEGVSVAYEFGDVMYETTYFGNIFHEGTFETISQLI
jgi:hypothetical protein